MQRRLPDRKILDVLTIRPSLFLLVLLAAFSAGVAAGQGAKKSKLTAPIQDSEKYFETFPYDKQVLSEHDQEQLNEVYGDFEGGWAEYARLVIFGKHGRVFTDPDTQDMLKNFKWYKANPKFSNSMLNATERKNLDIVRGIESGLHSHVMPGDLRFWQDRDIPTASAYKLNVVQLHVMRAEIEAIHGKSFTGEPWLQKYFEDRYWYKPVANYDPKSLNTFEKANMALLAKAEAKKSGNTLVPGALLAYGEKPISPEMLKNLNLYQLRLLRNEIYAIHGGRFHTKWIQDHFDGEEWYSPLPKGQDPKLTALDQRNIASIVKRENELHADLSTKKINASVLNGMLSDDASRLRDEIYARRGKVFKDKWLQSYFASMAWYKADPHFADKMLSPTERANIATIAKYEKSAIAKERMTEG